MKFFILKKKIFFFHKKKKKKKKYYIKCLSGWRFIEDNSEGKAQFISPLNTVGEIFDSIWHMNTAEPIISSKTKICLMTCVDNDGRLLGFFFCKTK